VAEADLIARARQQDETAWEALMRDHQEAAFRLAYLFLGDADDAADVAQEAFIRAYQALARFDAARPFRPWLLSIVANLARNRHRSWGRYVAALQRAWFADPRLRPDPRQTRQHEAATDDAQTLWRAVRQLKAPDQEVIYLRYFLDLSEAEMASALNIAPGTVKSRLHRAVGKLRTVIAAHFPDLREHPL